MTEGTLLLEALINIGCATKKTTDLADGIGPIPVQFTISGIDIPVLVGLKRDGDYLMLASKIGNKDFYGGEPLKLKCIDIALQHVVEYRIIEDEGGENSLTMMLTDTLFNYDLDSLHRGIKNIYCAAKRIMILLKQEQDIKHEDFSV